MSDAISDSLGAELSQREFDEARLALLRRKVSTFAIVVGLLLMVLAGLQWWVSIALMQQQVTRPGKLGMAAGLVVGVAIIVMQRVKRERYQRATLRSLVWRTIWIVTMSVLSQTSGAAVLSAGISESLRPLGFEGHLGPIYVLIIFMVVVHSAAAIIVPWTFVESCVPPAVWAGIVLISSQFDTSRSYDVAIGISLTALAGVPGIAITLLRAGGLRETIGLRLIGARYAEVERELAFARRLHERHFPKPVREGPIRLEYAYEPMRQIGGDFIEISNAPDGSMLVVMIDVTGHGVAAALAVNRLHGEMKLLLAESRDSMPGVIMSTLNRYVSLTLADESVFATAVAARVWPDGRTRLCIAGHPPPFLRTADGKVSAIEPTTPLLGPFPPDEFVADETELQLHRDDVLMLYTDGAIECRDASGADLGHNALQVIVATAPDHEKLPSAVLQRITAFRSGAAEDDVLIASISIRSPQP